MVLGDSKMIVNEGGNVFKSKDGVSLTQRINREDVPATIKWSKTNDPDSRILRATKFPFETVTTTDVSAIFIKHDPEDDTSEG